MAHSEHDELPDWECDEQSPSPAAMSGTIFETPPLQAASDPHLPSVAELSECLLAAGATDVLEWPLARLVSSIEDVDTRELFEHMASDHRGFNLRSVLRFRELDPWVARTCTQKEAALMRAQLQRWLEQSDDVVANLDTASWNEAIAQPELDLLAQRLLDLLQHSRGAGEAAPRFSRERGPQVDATRARVHAELCSDGRQASQGRFGVFQCEISLQGFEHNRLRAHCSCAAKQIPLGDEQQPRDFNCCHVRTLAANLLDCLHGPDTQLRRALQDVCTTPSWVRFFSALGEPHADEAAAAQHQASEQRLCYRLQVRADASIGVELLMQRRKRDGGYTRGSRIAPAEVPDSVLSEQDPVDQLALGLLRSNGNVSTHAASVALLRVLAGHPRVVAADDQRPIVLQETRVELELLEARNIQPGRASAAPFERASQAHSDRASHAHSDRASHAHSDRASAAPFEGTSQAHSDRASHAHSDRAASPAHFDRASHAHSDRASQAHSDRVQLATQARRVQSVRTSTETRAPLGAKARDVDAERGPQNTRAEQVAKARDLRREPDGATPHTRALHGAVARHPEHPSSGVLMARAQHGAQARVDQPEHASSGVLMARAQLGGASLQDVKELPRGDHLARWGRDTTQLLFAPLPAALARWVWTLSQANTLLPPESHAQLRKRLRELQPHVTLHLPPQLLGEPDAQPKKLLVRLENNLSEGVRLSLHSRPLAGGPVFVPGEGPSEVLGDDAGKYRYALRDLAWERNTVGELHDVLHLSAAHEQGQLRYNVEGREAALGMLERLARARELVEIEWLEGHRPLRLLTPIKRTDLKLKVGHAERWFEASGFAQLEAAQQVSLVALLDAARTGSRYVQVSKETYASLHEELRARLESAADAFFSERDKLKLSANVLPKFLELAPLAQIERAPSVDQLLERMRTADSEPCELPQPIASQLRPYQREGATFLLRLARWSSGACLADEMGLGKTIQTLAVLAARAELGPALVIAPTSVGHNWCAEAARFTPQLDVRLYRGERRSQLRKHLGPGSVLVTSYELATSDAPSLKDLQLATLVLDEAHMLKNAGTARARAIAGFSAQFRIALTGTPLENHLGELWSLMAQLNPALLGSFTQFRARFGLPIERYENAERLDVLRQLVSPFILRRDKRTVAPELPARVEATRVVPLSAAERALYDAAVSDLRYRIDNYEKFDLDRVSILAEITRLRQLACHPALVVSDWQKPSSKLRALLEVLDEILPRGHRALLFSQFVSHLQLVRRALEARGLPYLYLDGSTKAADRAQLAERWQAGESSLFLISLKAGGTGLNLSKADYVVQLDPWWNPAAEDQAADRAHRIGSDRPVTILRLLAQGTVEEQVAALHADKRELARSMLQETGAQRLAFEDLAAYLGLGRCEREDEDLK